MNPGRLKIWQQVVVFAIVLAAVISRRPDALFNPQFYAEDGQTWFADAWNLGWLHALSLTAGGYLNTLPRLVCAIAILVPLKSAPLLLNWFGIVIQALPATVLLTGRCSNWGPSWLRVAQACLYVSLPNSSELAITLTNAHWHLALAACLIAFANPPGTAGWKAFDIAVLLLTGLTGPWSLVLTPLVLVFWWYRRQTWSLVMASLLASCALVQAFKLLNQADRPVTELGANLILLVRLVAGQIYLGAVWGQNSFAKHGTMLPALLIFAAGTLTLGYGLLKLRLEMKLFIVFALLVTAAAFHSPLIAGPTPRWLLLADDQGGRYWFFPMLALVWCLLWWACLKGGLRPFRLFSFACFLIMPRAVWHDWHYRSYPDEHFATYVRAFNSANPGTAFRIPVPPVGAPMILIKK